MAWPPTTHQHVQDAIGGLGRMSPTGVGNLKTPEEYVGVTSMFTRAAVTLTEDLHTVRLRYVSWCVSATVNGWPSEEVSPVPVTYTVALETVGGRVIPLAVNGAATFTVNGSADTDPIDVDIPMSDGVVYVRTVASVTTGGFIACPIKGSGAPDDVQTQLTGATTSQAAGTGPIVNAVSGAGLGAAPVAIYNSASKRTRVLAVIGDSIAAGQGDVPSSTRGYITLALRNNGAVSYVKLAKGGERAGEWGSSPAAHQRRAAMLVGCTDALHEYGISDITSFGTLAGAQSSLIKSWMMLVNRGLRVAQTTITPYTTTSDDWQTVVNQTSFAQESVRVALNTWLRDGAPMSAGAAVSTGTGGALRAGAAGHPLAAIIEIADMVESARNSGKWKAAATGTLNTTNGSTAVTGLTGTWAVGDIVKGPGLAASTWLTSVSGSTGTLADPATATATGVAVYSPMTTDGIHPTSKCTALASQAPDLVAYLGTLTY